MKKFKYIYIIFLLFSITSHAQEAISRKQLILEGRKARAQEQQDLFNRVEKEKKELEKKYDIEYKTFIKNKDFNGCVTSLTSYRTNYSNLENKLDPYKYPDPFVEDGAYYDCFTDFLKNNILSNDPIEITEQCTKVMPKTYEYGDTEVIKECSDNIFIKTTVRNFCSEFKDNKKIPNFLCPEEKSILKKTKERTKPIEQQNDVIAL